MRSVWGYVPRIFVAFLLAIVASCVVPVTASAEIVPVTCSSWYPDTDPGAGVGMGCDAWSPSEAPQPLRYCEDGGPPRWQLPQGQEPATCVTWRYENMSYDQPPPPTTSPTTPPGPVAVGPVTLEDSQWGVIAATCGLLVFFSSASFIASLRRR